MMFNYVEIDFIFNFKGTFSCKLRILKQKGENNEIYGLDYYFYVILLGFGFCYVYTVLGLTASNSICSCIN